MNVHFSDTIEAAATVTAGALTLSVANAVGGDMAGFMPFVVPAVSAIVGVAMGYAVLRSTVQAMQADLKETRTDMKAVLDKMNDKAVAIARIEERLKTLER
jgi:hypothetical protein